MDVDPNWVMALSTIVLVVVTAFYAWRTSTIAKATEAMAEATSRSVDVANTSLILQYAPVVVARRSSGGGSTSPDGEYEVGISLENIGAGTAFGVSIMMNLGPKGMSAGPFATLEPRMSKRVKFRVRYGDYEGAGKRWSAEILYRDLLNRPYAVLISETGGSTVTLEGEPLRLPSSLREQSLSPETGD